MTHIYIYIYIYICVLCDGARHVQRFFDLLNASREALSNDVHHHTCTRAEVATSMRARMLVATSAPCRKGIQTMILNVVDAFCRPDIVKDLVKAANKLATTKK